MTIELNRKTMTAKDMIELLSKVPPETELEVAVDEGSGYYTCQNSFFKIGVQYYGSFGKSATVSLFVGDGHSVFDKERIEDEED